MPSVCSREATISAAGKADAARKSLLSLPIGDGLNTDVSPDAQHAVAMMKRRLNGLFVTYMACAGENAEPSTIEKELTSLSHAIVLESRSYGVNELPKEAFNYGYQLQFKAQRRASGPPIIGISANFQVECGMDATLGIFEWQGTSWNQVIEWTSKPYKTVAGAFWSFDYGISPPDDTGRWYVVSKFINPWCSSTWSGINYSVLRPVPRQLEPKILFSGSDFMWWGNEDYGTLSVNRDNFDLRFHSASIDGGVHNRVWIRHYNVKSDSVQRIQPVAVSPRDFVDEWITSSWKNASSWSAATAHGALKMAHERIRKGGFDEYDSVHKCTNEPNHYQVALERDDQRILYFQVEELGDSFTMLSVGRSPKAQCAGPNILDSMATK